MNKRIMVIKFQVYACLVEMLILSREVINLIYHWFFLCK